MSEESPGSRASRAKAPKNVSGPDVPAKAPPKAAAKAPVPKAAAKAPVPKAAAKAPGPKAAAKATVPMAATRAPARAPATTPVSAPVKLPARVPATAPALGPAETPGPKDAPGVAPTVPSQAAAEVPGQVESEAESAGGQGEYAGLFGVIAYTSVLLIAEVSTSRLGPIPGAMLDAALVPLLLAHFALRPDAPYRRMFPALALIALLRTLSIAAVVPRLPEYWWYAAVGLPVLAGALLASRLIDAPSVRLAITIRRPEFDTILGLLGFPIGLVGYAALRPDALLKSGDPLSILVVMAVLTVFGGFLEELVYRGILQRAAIDAFGSQWAGIFFAATLGALMYWGTGEFAYMFVIWLLGIGYGLALVRGASLWGIAASHSVALWGMALFWPLLFR